MKVIIFATNDYSDTPYKTWFNNFEIDFVFLTTNEFQNSYRAHGPCINIVQGEANFSDEIVENLRSYKADFIFARNEKDVIPAAVLREKLNITGQTIASAEAYRNKFVMKTYVSSTDTKLPDYKVLNSAMECNQLPFPMPWVLKPLDESGSGGVSIISSKEELADWTASEPAFPLLAESFVQGSMYHIDGVAIDGKVLWSHVGIYLQGCLAFRDDTYAGSCSVPQDSALATKLKNQTKAVISALPDAGVHTFHAEFFVTETGDPVFCEIASRTPGGRIKQFTKSATGIDLDKLCLELHMNPSKTINADTYEWMGWILAYPKKGRLTNIGPGVAHPAILVANLHGTLGTEYHGGQKSGRGVWSCLFKANPNSDPVLLAKEIYDNFSANIVWERSLVHIAKEKVWSL